MQQEYNARDLVIVSYFLSRFGEEFDEKSGKVKSSPPAELEIKEWNRAYEFFFLRLGNHRNLETFSSYLSNTRDEFDYFLEEVTTRVGHKKEKLPPLRESVFIEMQGKTRAEIWSYVSKFGKSLQDLDIVSDIEAIDSADTDATVGSSEGKTRFRILRTRERDPKLRREAIVIHGLNCKACDFNFGDVYGEWGEGFIEIHHSTPISDYSTEGEETNPASDLIPLCSNCHRMIHRKKDRLLTLDELKSMLNRSD